MVYEVRYLREDGNTLSVYRECNKPETALQLAQLSDEVWNFLFTKLAETNTPCGAVGFVQLSGASVIISELSEGVVNGTTD